MSILNISVPEDVRAFVNRQAAGGGFNNESEYVLELIRAEQRRAASNPAHENSHPRSESSDASKTADDDLLEAKLLEGINSGPSIEVDEAYWEQKQSELLRRHANPNGG